MLVKTLKFSTAKNAMYTQQSRGLYLGCNVSYKVKGKESVNKFG